MLALGAGVGCGDGLEILLGDVTSQSHIEAGPPPPAGAEDASFEASGPSSDAPASVPSEQEAEADSPAMAPDAVADSGVFGPATLVTELVDSTYINYKETLTADMLEIYFCSDRPGGPGGPEDIWRSKRAHATDAWGPVTLVTEVSTASRDLDPAVAPDGLSLWLSSDRPGGKGAFDIWVSTRASNTAAWSAPKDVTELNTASDEYPRPPIRSGLAMPPAYREKLPNNQFQTSLTSRASPTAALAAPTRLSDVDTANIDTDGFLTDDELTLYFSSDRVTTNDQDLYVAQRATPKSAFTSFTPIAEINTTHQERDPWVSADGRDIYFSSDRGGSLQIYHASR